MHIFVEGNHSVLRIYYEVWNPLFPTMLKMGFVSWSTYWDPGTLVLFEPVITTGNTVVCMRNKHDCFTLTSFITIMGVLKSYSIGTEMDMPIAFRLYKSAFPWLALIYQTYIYFIYMWKARTLVIVCLHLYSAAEEQCLVGLANPEILTWTGKSELNGKQIDQFLILARWVLFQHTLLYLAYLCALRTLLDCCWESWSLVANTRWIIKDVSPVSKCRHENNRCYSTFALPWLAASLSGSNSNNRKWRVEAMNQNARYSWPSSALNVGQWT